jgi:acid phosphatase type 7
VIVTGLVPVFPGDSHAIGGFNSALAASDPVIAAAGDIACDPMQSTFNNGSGTSNSCRQKYTSNLLVNAGLTAVLDLGDNQYYCGGYNAFLQSYDLSWGRVKSITHPSVGNHEYLTSGGTDCTSSNEGAAGYFDYFGSAAGKPGQGYYSFNVGAWHIIALNSNCSNVGGCGSGSPQYKWLQADLAAHTNYCTLAYWHIPLFSSGGRANSNSKPFWQLLYNYDADVILNGHDHIYERFGPQDPNGVADSARGIREFIVGTGGSDHTTIVKVVPNSLVRNTDTFGVLKLTLHPASYSWQFVPESGKTFTDSGSRLCHGPNPPTSVPTRTPTPDRTPTRTPTRTPAPSRTPTKTPTRAALLANTTPTPGTPAATGTPTRTPTSVLTPGTGP